MHAESPPQDQSQTNRIIRSKGLVLTAALVSSLLPGSGHFLLRERMKGLANAVAFLIALMLFWPFRTPTSRVGSLIAVLILKAICIAAGVMLLRRSKEVSKWWMLPIVLIGFVWSSALSGVVLRTAGFGVFEMMSSSMEPTIAQYETVAIDYRAYSRGLPARRDLIAFRREGTITMKRVIALPGEMIKGVDGTIWVNGQLLNEPYAQHGGNPPEELNNFGPVQIGSRQLFVLGDNRDLSLDSRSFGPIDLGDVVGKVLYVIPTQTRPHTRTLH
jgi:signal peptidase I